MEFKYVECYVYGYDNFNDRSGKELSYPSFVNA